MAAFNIPVFPVPQSPYHDMVKGILESYGKTRYGFPQQEADLQKSLIESKYLPQEKETNLALKQEQIKRQQQLSQMPFGGQHVPGVAGEIVGLELLKQQYGEDSPQYQLGKRNLESQIKGRESLSTMRESPYRFAPTQQKNILSFEDQLQKEFPQYDRNTISQMSNAYLQGEKELNGQELPDLSSQSQYLKNNIQKASSTAFLQNQAAALSNTVNELKNIDIEPIKHFAGLKGKADYIAQKSGIKPRSQEWRDYNAFKNVQSILIMDTLRNSLKTSIVPGYVYETIGKFSNPNDEMWDDPQQVQKKWDTLIEWLNRSSKNISKQAKFGATTELSEENNIKQKSENKNIKKWKISNGKLVEA